MEYNQLRYFQVVARCESITKAAEELHITQSAQSKVIGGLETELGCQMFERQKRRMRFRKECCQWQKLFLQQFYLSQAQILTILLC